MIVLLIDTLCRINRQRTKEDGSFNSKTLIVLAVFVLLFTIAGTLDLYSEYHYRSNVKEIVGEDTSIICYKTYQKYAKLINLEVWTTITAMSCLDILQLCMLKHLYTLINPNKRQIKRRPASK
jgi:hypothetical protein